MATMIRRLLQNNPSLSRLCTVNQTLISSSSSSSSLIHTQSPTIQSNPFTSFTSQTFESSTRSLGNLRAFSSGPVNHNPQNFKYPKHHKASQKGVSNSKISFGEFALQVLEHARISSRQLEAGRRALSRHVRTGGQFWVRVNPDKSMTGKPAGTRMGRGKGAVQYWVAVVKPGKIVYEVGGVPEAIARKAISLAASKMSVRTRFLGHFTRLNKRNFSTNATLISSPSSFPAQFSTVSSNSFSTITSQNFQPSTQLLGNRRAFCSSSGPSNLVPIKSPEEFKNSLSKAQDESLPAVFYFTAAWCGPCRLIAPKIIEWSKEYPHVMTYKIDIDEKGMEDTVREMEITAVPTFIFFHNGKKASHIVGATYDSLIDTMRRLYKQD